jgi:hypothetical protein
LLGDEFGEIMRIMAGGTNKSSGLSSPGSAAASREPHLFRFGLRQMFAFTSGVALLGAVMALLGGRLGATLGFATLLIAAHVLATSVGTRLRNSSREIQRWNAGRPGAPFDGPPPAAPLGVADRAALAASPLALSERAPWRTAFAATAGVVIGGTLGAAGIPLIAGPQAPASGLVVGAASCGVIGAWLALLAANFWMIARRTWRDANGDSTAEPMPSCMRKQKTGHGMPGPGR